MPIYSGVQHTFESNKLKSNGIFVILFIHLIEFLGVETRVKSKVDNIEEDKRDSIKNVFRQFPKTSADDYSFEKVTIKLVILVLLKVKYSYIFVLY